MTATPFLMYHRIGRRPKGTTVPGHYVSESQLARQVAWLSRRGFVGVGMDEAFVDDGRKKVVMTFDDGYTSFLPAAQILRSAQWRGIVFLVSDLVGKTNEWDEREGDVTERLMGWDEVREALKMGMEVGSHTCTHARLAEVSPEKAAAEIRESKTRLEQELGIPIQYFCYPYGSQNDDVRQLVVDAGYRGACSTRKGVNDHRTDPYRWNRINVRSDTLTPILFWKIWREMRKSRSNP